MSSAPEVRISDEDRNQIVALLSRHTADGRLTLDEFADRVEVVYLAKTRAELDRTLADLPAAPAPNPVPGQRRATRTVVAFMTGSRRSGTWRVGQKVRAFAIMGGVDLDLRQAIIDGSELTITAVALMGGVKVIVPEGIDVDMTGIPIMGGKHIRLADVPLIPGAPFIRVRAFPIMGGVYVASRRSRSRPAG